MVATGGHYSQLQPSCRSYPGRTAACSGGEVVRVMTDMEGISQKGCTLLPEGQITDRHHSHHSILAQCFANRPRDSGALRRRQ